jgi:hypothetical protein
MIRVLGWDSSRTLLVNRRHAGGKGPRGREYSALTVIAR